MHILKNVRCQSRDEASFQQAVDHTDHSQTADHAFSRGRHYQFCIMNRMNKISCEV